MEIKTEVNYKINWENAIPNIYAHVIPSSTVEKDIEKINSDRKHYFDMLQRLMSEISNVDDDKVNAILKKYNVHLIDIDNFPRVNIDEPT